MAFIVDEVDDPAVLGLGAPGDLDRRGLAVQLRLHHLDAAREVRPDAVHLVDEGDAGNAVAVGLAPHRLGLRLDAGHRVEHRDGAVEDAQRALDLGREVHVARRVDDVDADERLPTDAFQKQVVAADVIVMPRSCSWTIQSIVAVPSWTSPIL